MASLQRHAAVLLSLGLLAACGGDRSRAGTGMDTTGAAPVTPGQVARPPADSAASRDTAQPPAPAPGKDTSARPAAATPGPKPAPKPAPVKQVAAAPSRPPGGPVKRDTAAPQPAESTGRAAAPAPTPAPSDTAATTASAPDVPLRDAYHAAPRDTVSEAVYDGWKQFNLNCARCHGEDVLGTTIAPHLLLSLKPDGPINTKELFVQTVCAGRPAKGMPAWCALGLELGKINDIYEYVKGRSDAKIAPGRPAVRRPG